MGGTGAWTAFWAILVLAVLALAVAATMWVVRSLTARDQGRPPLPPEDRAWAELRRRYAAGEIDREEFLERKVDLEA
ncbi:SHOCT domain-containing protein [Nonomuraea sp. 10N515B]|uniref:SHOCT domain-containing protein n=1 Tax=Nonomuraea sp. 10N515B TaxID=3457422 RepID=UPI003FCD5919